MNENRIRIAIDAMGGDLAPDEVVAGTVLAARANKQASLLLVGPIPTLEGRLSGERPKNIRLVPAEETIKMGESASRAVRKMERSSIAVGLRLVKDGKADGFVSAGNSGAVMSTALFTLGRIKSVLRPPIAVVIPAFRGPFVLLDAGANADCKAQHLLQFAHMGRAYASNILGTADPVVGLLNIGEEPGKGNALYRKAYALLEAADIRFAGNIEGGAVPRGDVQVLVCDGFSGNVVLKLMEGTTQALMGEFKAALTGSVRSGLGAMLIRPGLESLKKRIDYEEYGGAELLGVGGVCVISHGSSKAKAIKNAIDVAAKSITANVVKEVEHAL
ncbi:MAG: phosphate acyltransferase PlsX [Terriglobia bacterium]